MRWLRAASLALLWGLAPSVASGAVFHSKQSAFDAGFPAGSTVTAATRSLSADDAAYIKQRSGVRWSRPQITVYTARLHGQVVAYGYFDTHRVRSLNQTVLLVVRPDGALETLLQVAFHEPPEYQAPARFLAQFKGHHLNAALSLRGDIDGLSGATLTARSLTAHTRAILAAHRRLMGQ